MQQQIDAGHLVPPFAIEGLGYVIVRIVESFIYSDQLVGRKPNLEVGRNAIRALLSASPNVARAKTVKRSMWAKK